MAAPKKVQIGTLKDFTPSTENVTTAGVLAKKNDWSQINAAGLMDQAELELLLAFDQKSDKEQSDVLAQKGSAIGHLFYKLLCAIKDASVIQYLVTVIDELLINDAKYCAIFNNIRGANVEPFAPFIQILTHPEESKFTVLKCAHVLGMLISTANLTAEVVPSVKEYLAWVMGKVAEQQANAGGSRDISAALVSLKAALRNPVVQNLFAVDENLNSISKLLTPSPNTQIVYDAVFCMWILTYNAGVTSRLKEQHLAERITQILGGIRRPKVVRVCVQALRNLLDKEAFNEEMLDAGLAPLLPKVLASLQEAKSEDNEVLDDIKVIGETLEKSIKILTSFEVYERELIMGKLRWGPVHTERFWRENAIKFEKENFKLVRMLIALLTSQDTITVAVACYDLGEFARFHPNGRRMVAKLQGKEGLMLHLSSPNPDITKQALLAVQKIMVNNWEYLQTKPAK